MFARWDNEVECLSEMMLFHSEEDARRIVDSIKQRQINNTLFKSADVPMQVLKEANGDLVVYGPCSWEVRDPVGDIVTTKFMVNFFDKLFNKVAPEYQNIMIDHGNYKIGTPLRKYVSPTTGEAFFTHVHEKAPMLVAKIRPDDGLETTKKYRKLIENGDYKSYSISWFPLKYDVTVDPNTQQSTNTHYDGDPVEVTICRYGMVDAAKFNIVKNNNIIDKPFHGFDNFADCHRHMMDGGHTTEQSDRICGHLQADVEGKMSWESYIKVLEDCGIIKSDETIEPETTLDNLIDTVNKEIIANIREGLSANQAVSDTVKAIKLDCQRVDEANVTRETLIALDGAFKEALNIGGKKENDSSGGHSAGR